MSEDFFRRLEAELGSLLQSGNHLDHAARARRRTATRLRRAVATLALAAALAASLDGEFPASATGYTALAQASAVIIGPSVGLPPSAVVPAQPAAVRAT